MSMNLNQITDTITPSTSACTFAKPIILATYTVATLPAGTVGMIAFVTDALLPAFLTTVAGGGAVKTPVFYNGSNWVAI